MSATINHGHKTKGFTLIEIVMVLAVVCILAASAFAVFARVQENGRMATCQSNLRQIGLGVRLYVQDNDSKFPNMMLPHDIPHIKSKAIFQCPSVLRAGEFTLNHYAFTGAITTRLSGKWEGRHDSAFAYPATTVMLYETVGEDEEFTGFCVVEAIYRAQHFGGTNYGFVDGHVKWMTPSQHAEMFCATPLETS